MTGLSWLPVATNWRASLNEIILYNSDWLDKLTALAQYRVDGLAVWHDPGLWHRAKQEISPAAAPLYGDLVGRLIAAKKGKLYKCLVMDLDNRLWGGVVGDDGLGVLSSGRVVH